RIAAGELGKLRRIYVEYPQGWLAERIEKESGNNAGWRTDPKLSGKAGCMGDIGTHAWHLCDYLTRLKGQEMCDELLTFVPVRPIDDDDTAMMRMEQGEKALLAASQNAIGNANNINIRVYGEKGSLKWVQEDPNNLFFNTRYN